MEFLRSMLHCWAAIIGLILVIVIFGLPLWLFLAGGFWLINHS